MACGLFPSMSNEQVPCIRDAKYVGGARQWRCRCRWRYQIEMAMDKLSVRRVAASRTLDGGRYGQVAQRMGRRPRRRAREDASAGVLRTREGGSGPAPVHREGAARGVGRAGGGKELADCWIWRGRAYRSTGISMMVARPGRARPEAKSHVCGSRESKQEGRGWLREGRPKEYVVPAQAERKTSRTSARRGRGARCSVGSPGARSEQRPLPELARTLSSSNGAPAAFSKHNILSM